MSTEDKTNGRPTSKERRQPELDRRVAKLEYERSQLRSWGCQDLTRSYDQGIQSLEKYGLPRYKKGRGV